MSGRPAIFLDRDGTLNELLGYVNHASRFRLFPWTVEAVRTIREAGYLAIVVTNQSGIGRGLIEEDVVREVHQRFRSILGEAGIELDGLYCCPHAPSDRCDCRKPKPGMLLRARDEHDVDLAASWIVGDSESDLEAGWNAGARAALVRTGFGEGAFERQRGRGSRPADLVGANLFEAVCAILWGVVD